MQYFKLDILHWNCQKLSETEKVCTALALLEIFLNSFYSHLVAAFSRLVCESRFNKDRLFITISCQNANDANLVPRAFSPAWGRGGTPQSQGKGPGNAVERMPYRIEYTCDVRDDNYGKRCRIVESLIQFSVLNIHAKLKQVKMK